MNIPFFNREAELDFLRKKLKSRQPELLIFRGRRRVGKTFLLKEFSRQVNGLYLLATVTSVQDQLQVFSKIVSDYFMNFWFNFVFSNRTALETGGRERIMEKIVRPTFDKFISRVCESIIRQLLQKDFFELGLRFERLGRHWESQTEIDVFGYTEAGNTLIGESKWTQSPVGEETVQALEKKIARVHALTRGKIQKMIISKSGFVKGLARKHADLTLIDLGKHKV